ncbi:alpha-amylase family glycosyl hydrolase [Vibrio lentus]|nr:alpha-amylase family glycosyl hydrolase [Vibrio lentus]
MVAIGRLPAEKLDYIESLSANAIWITSPLEQIHGWVGGGDRVISSIMATMVTTTKIGPSGGSMGTEDELKTFIDTAHSKGIRVVWDVVMNHTIYATLADMQEFDFGSSASPMKKQQNTWRKLD